jgi:hypothetical protein
MNINSPEQKQGKSREQEIAKSYIDILATATFANKEMVFRWLGWFEILV